MTAGALGFLFSKDFVMLGICNIMSIDLRSDLHKCRALDGPPPRQRLGYANGWSSTPAIVTECKAKQHQMRTVNEGRCLNRYICDECNYDYAVDSGD